MSSHGKLKNDRCLAVFLLYIARLKCEAVIVYHPSIMVFTRKHGRRGLGLLILIGLGYAGYHFYGTRGTVSPTRDLPAVNTQDLQVPAVDPTSIGKVITDKASGKEFISNQLIVEFVAGTTEDAANAIIASVGGKMVAHFTKAPVYLVQVEDSADGSIARTATTKIKGDSRVKSADLNFLTTAPVPTEFEKATAQ